MTFDNLKKNKKIRLTKDAYIHSDQGAHYISPIYQKLVEKIKTWTIDIKTRKLLGKCPSRILFREY